MRTYRPLQERPVIAACSQLHSNVCVDAPRNPKRAATLSLCPGLGQLYNGETGKGLLFVCAFFVNVLLFLSFVFQGAALSAIGMLAALAQQQIDPEAIKWFSTVPAGSPFLLIYAGLILTFVAYAVRDAYDRAAVTWKGAVHPKFFLGLPEATSGSYLAHFTIMVCGLVMMLFIVAPKEPTEQYTDIQLIPPPPAPPPKPKPDPPRPKARQEEPKKQEVVQPQPKPVEQKVEPQKTEPLPVATTPAPVAPAPAASSGPPSDSSSGTAGDGQAQAPSSGDGQDVDFGPYLAELQKRIKKNWFPPRGNESKRITVKFKIHKDGEITSVKLEKSSGLSIADDAALEAIDKISPLPPLPAGADNDLVIRFTFDYNVFNGGNQSAAGAGAISN